MKQRFGLIGYEKVSYLSPVGKQEGSRGMCLAHARIDSHSFDLLDACLVQRSPSMVTSKPAQNKHVH